MNLARACIAFPFLVLACGENTPPPATPAATTETTTTTSTTAAVPGEGAPATGQATCTSADVKGTPDRDACMAKCAPLSEKAPEGTRCLPPRLQCQMNCDQLFKTAK
jgi:hypothetical protein